MIGETLRSTVGALRIRSQRADTPQLRQSVGSRLRSISLEPGSMPPSAILVVRELNDPLPGELRCEGLHVERRWEKALQVSVDQMYRAATRPNRGVINGNPNAVLFSDHAELVACLCADLSAGRAFGRWWWRQLLSASALAKPVSATIGGQMVRRPETIPVVVDLLLQWGCASEVLAVLSRDDAAAITSAMLFAYDESSLAVRLLHESHDAIE